MKVSPINSYENKYFNVHNKKAIDYAQDPFAQNEEISFKALPILDFVRGVKNTYPPKEIVNKNIGQGILYKKLKQINPKLLQSYKINDLLEALPLKTPQTIDALAKVIDLRSKSVSWSQKLDAQMLSFFEQESDKKDKFNEELFNVFYDKALEASKSPNAIFEFYMEKYMALLSYCKDKNGIHPEIFNFAQYDGFHVGYLKYLKEENRNSAIQ